MPRNTSAERSIDWASLIQDLCEREVLTQARLGVALHTTQQSVSNWLNGRRMPGPAAAKKLLEMIEAAGLEILDYRHSEKVMAKYRKQDQYASLPKRVRDLCGVLKGMHPRRRNKVMTELTDMVEFYEEKNK